VRRMPSDLEWEALGWPGLEHVITRTDAAGFRADSQLIAGPPFGPVRVSYQVSCDPDGRVTELTISAASAAGSRTLTLIASPDGRWRADGRPRPDLDGCADVDISLTPLTNTLPIRRLSWSPGTPHDLNVVYVRAPELSVEPVRQRYTLLSRDADCGAARYRYESGSFSADLAVDADGYVTDYPGRWRRVERAGPAAP
jgi:uncharacterized protein